MKTLRNSLRLVISLSFHFSFPKIFLTNSRLTPFQDRRQGRQLTSLTSLPIRQWSKHSSSITCFNPASLFHLRILSIPGIFGRWSNLSGGQSGRVRLPSLHPQSGREEEDSIRLQQKLQTQGMTFVLYCIVYIHHI